MTRDCHVQFGERLAGKFRWPTHLDFSYIGLEHPSVESLTQIFNEVADMVLEETGFEFSKTSIQFEIFKNPRDSFSIQGGIKYRGPVRPQVGLAQMPRIKIDITLMNHLYWSRF